MKNKINRVLITATSVILFFSFLVSIACTQEARDKGKAAIVNPAAVYCDKLGYKLDESGNCVFPDGSKCAEWAFFRGRCGQQFTFCQKQGFKIENRTDNMGSWTAEYAVCVFDDGSECLEQDYFEGKCSRGECKKWKLSEGECLRSVVPPKIKEQSK